MADNVESELKIRLSPRRGALTSILSRSVRLQTHAAAMGVARPPISEILCNPSRKASGLSQLKNDQALRFVFFLSPEQRMSWSVAERPSKRSSVKPSIRSPDMSAQREKTEVRCRSFGRFSHAKHARCSDGRPRRFSCPGHCPGGHRSKSGRRYALDQERRGVKSVRFRPDLMCRC